MPCRGTGLLRTSNDLLTGLASKRRETLVTAECVGADRWPRTEREEEFWALPASLLHPSFLLLSSQFCLSFAREGREHRAPSVVSWVRSSARVPCKKHSRAGEVVQSFQLYWINIQANGEREREKERLCSFTSTWQVEACKMKLARFARESCIEQKHNGTRL